MNWLVWLLRLLGFVLVLLFALNNTAPVNVTFYAGYNLPDVPLIVVMLVSFLVGAVFVWLLTLPPVLRHRRELARLRRNLERIEKNQQRLEQQAVQRSAPSAAVAAETAAPLAPL